MVPLGPLLGFGPHNKGKVGWRVGEPFRLRGEKLTEFTHFDEHGASRMVDIGSKKETDRMARAFGLVIMAPATLEKIRVGQLGKGNVLEVARLAGIMAAKKTHDLIPLCHHVALTSVQIAFSLLEPDRVAIEATAHTQGRTGVEMEALVAASIAGLTIYDMCKSVDRVMKLAEVRLEEKTGGAHGDFLRPSDPTTFPGGSAGKRLDPS